MPYQYLVYGVAKACQGPTARLAAAGAVAGAIAGGAVAAVLCASAFFMMSRTEPVASAPVNIKNKAFVFVKPYACTKQGDNLVRETLKMKGFNVNRG